MKKLWSMVIMVIMSAALLLSAYTVEGADTALNFPNMDWKMGREEVMQAGGFTEEDLADYSAESQYSSVLIKEGYEVFGVESVYTAFELFDFGSGKQELFCVTVNYPDDADMEHVLEEMEKAYGETVSDVAVYELFDPLVAASTGQLYKKDYAQSEHVKIWSGRSVSEAVPKGQEDDYKRVWQEKSHPEATRSFQPGLNDENWEEFSQNAKMNVIFWLEEGQDVMYSGNTLCFLALNQHVYDEVTRRIENQE